MSDIVSWTSYLFAISILVVLLGGLGLFGYAVQKGWLLQQVTGLRQLGGSDRRLKLRETLVIDPRRRLVILQADGEEHVVLRLGWWAVLGVRCRVDDAVHVQEEVVVLEPVRVWLRTVDRDLLAVVSPRRLLLDAVDHDLRVLDREPLEEGRNTHRARAGCGERSGACSWKATAR